MLDLIALIVPWLNNFRQPSNSLKPLELLPWQETAIFTLPPGSDDRLAWLESNRLTESIVRTYLQNLASQGINSEKQGIWVQSDWVSVVSNQGTTALPAASLTKIATTLTALGKWEANHQFITNIYLTGEIKNGVVRGDLIVEGSGDPLFVWEEAIALGNKLNQLGIRQVQGDLLVTDRFYMNYQAQAQVAGKLLKQGLDRKLWQSEITQQYLQMPPGTAQPEVAIAGGIKLIAQVPATAQLIVNHQSLPLAEILRQMNIYSNNKMAQILADLAGGATNVAQYAAEQANFALTEIELINGSGLGEENRISPRAVCQMLMAIDRLLEDNALSVVDLFPTAGRDLVGTVQDRGLPPGTTVKTGTLDNVSALAGVISTSDRGKVYFVIINNGRQVKYFRQQQDQLLNELVQTWQLIPYNVDLAQKNDWYLGDPQRNLIQGE
ncbi:D-alanyl-D-alanine carboxypeptidase [Pleurocapsa sp. PCC 7319]|uniref:D-alanyl-D-alanine carboxypeptidase n=1 Tax=Pleurocapsa sp. PCC 7319 TaxID=118161 RepID=UPI000347AB03|nr:D-alanyl-D-alanine carboxypeptidase [Pleurocapsa sp. PCC 7319]